MNLDWRSARLGVIGLLVLASCFHGPTSPTATLAPRNPDGPQRVAGPFAVVYAAPKGHVADRKQPGVTVMFSRGVRSVDMSDDEHVPPIAIRSKTGGPVKGQWRWTGTRGLLFTPETELPGGSDFVVTVPPDVKALDGSVLGSPYTLELETDGPSLAAFRVVGPPGVTEHTLPSDPSFRLQFDQAVDPNAVLAAATLRVFKADGDRGETIKMTAARDTSPAAPAPAPSSSSSSSSSPAPKPKGGTPPVSPPPPRQVPETYTVVLKPEKPLPLDHQVELTVANTLRGVGGPRAMTNPITKVMRTHGPLRFVDFYCPRIEAKGRCRASGDVKVVMSNPVSRDEMKAHVKTKAPPRPPAKDKGRIEPVTEHWLGVSPKLGEKYQITLTAGMKDVYGQKLEKDVSFEVDVESPLVRAPGAAVASASAAPSARPAPPPPVKPPVAAAPAVVDPRPRRERLPYRLDLGLAGQVLEAALGPQGHKVPVGAVNIPTYSTVTAALTDAQAATWTLARGADFVTRNGLAATWTTTHADTNQRQVDFIDLDAVLSPRKGRGPALIVLAPPGAGRDGYGRTESFVNLTDLGVSAKMSPFGSLIWVTQLSTGKPVQNANVAIRTVKAGEVFTATTDAQGLVIVPNDRFDPLQKDKDQGDGDDQDGRVRSDAAIVVRSGDDWTITKIGHSSVESRLTSEFQSLSKMGHWVGMLFADRGVFRPGETAKVAGIVRVAENDTLRSIAGRDLRIQLTDHNGEQIFDGRARCDDLGTFTLDLPIPKSAEIGTATITATALAGGKSNTAESGVFRHEIRILAFKPNEFKVSAEPDKPSYVRGDTAVFSAQGDYLYGAPMQGAAITTTVSRQEVPYSPPNSEGFTTSDDIFTGDYAESSKSAEAIDSQDGELDPRGHFERRVALSFEDQRKPERVVFDADVTDISRNNVSARSSAIVHPGEFYVGLRTPADRFVAAGTALKSEVVAFEPNGNHRAGVKVKVELVERRWNAVTGEQPDGKPTRSSKAQDVVLTSCDAVTTATSGTCNLQVPHAGYFVMRATAADPRGNTVRSSTSVYGTEDTPTTQTAWPTDDRHAIKLEPNKKMYEIGDTAKVILRNPFKEGQALVTVERNGVMWKQVVPIKGPLPVIDIPVRADFYPNAFVSVVAIRGRVQAPPAGGGADLGGPEYRYGWAELKVNQEAHRLDVKVTQPKAEYQPGTIVESDVLVKDRSGKPVETGLTFYVVDEGVLALTSYVTPDPLPAFVTPRKLSVFTFDNREGLAHILPMKAGERLPSLGFEYALARNPGDSYDKGDDGGDGGSTLKRADFKTTAYFEAGRRTDKSGKAHFSFKLPDNLTTFRVMAVAAAVDDRFGSGESKLTTFRRLMARPALPRLIRVGDQLEASVVVSSKVDEKSPERGGTMPVNVKLDAKGLVVSGPATRQITLPRGGQMEVRFPVKAVVPGEAVIQFEVKSGTDIDQVEMRRQVELPVSKESSVVYGETSGDAAVGLGDLTTMRRDYGGLEVRVSSSALVGIGSTFDRLSEYPYGCTEQLTSKLLPLVSMFDLAKSGGAKLPSDINASIDSSIETLLKRQNSDGGFGFWESTNSKPWLSAYTMLAIAGASEKKRFVPRDAIERGREYLNFRLAEATRTFAKVEAERDPDKEIKALGPNPTPAQIQAAAEKREKEAAQKEIDYASAALIADTLASLGYPNPGAMNVLYDARGGQRLFGQAALLHAMAKAEMPAAQVTTLKRELQSRLRVSANNVDVDEPDSDKYGQLLESRTRTLAMMLRALLAADPRTALAPRMAKRLLALRASRKPTTPRSRSRRISAGRICSRASFLLAAFARTRSSSPPITSSPKDLRSASP